MSDIVKGVLGGGWSLVVGWLLPAAVNLLLFGLLVVPRLDATGPVRWLRDAEPERQGLTLLVAAVMLGLLLAAVQTPLYRLLEGYVGWRPEDPATPGRWRRAPVSALLGRCHQRQLERKQILVGRLDLLELSALESAGRLRDDLRARYTQVCADSRLARYAAADARRSATQRGLLREQVRRYPISDGEVLPTRLGNAIRRLEEYGHDRFRLDSQRLWDELYALAPDQARKQVDQARTTVDFMVCLLYGHLLVAGSAVLAVLTGTGRPVLLLIAAVLAVLSYGWYRLAVVATDDWAAATRALVNIGRKPLAEGLGLRIPATIADERVMWATASRLASRPYDTRSAEGDGYRAGGGEAE